ncbi:DUF488 family protein [Luteococcus sp.]|uniref:DUF488 domain-containing protein n=1 Tax=Luteococcus sp. TaxID=1969402 RepID=UPI0037370FD8
MSMIHTIGHSTRPLEELVDLLESFQVTHLVDIRTVPGSRHNPQYSERVLADELPGLGIDYCRMKGLGGLRKTQRDSPNMGWRNASFRGYADYMQTAEFARAVEELAELARAHCVAIMCAEAVPWRCHRSMVGDAMLVRGFEVLDIMGLGKATPHKLTRFAVVERTQITYPPEQDSP